jgi:hypothetical protein
MSDWADEKAEAVLATYRDSDSNAPLRDTIALALREAAAEAELRAIFTESGAFTELVIEKVLAPSPCGNPGHFLFQINGSACIACQDKKTTDRGC